MSIFGPAETRYNEDGSEYITFVSSDEEDLEIPAAPAPYARAGTPPPPPVPPPAPRYVQPGTPPPPPLPEDAAGPSARKGRRAPDYRLPQITSPDMAFALGWIESHAHVSEDARKEPEKEPEEEEPLDEETEAARMELNTVKPLAYRQVYVPHSQCRFAGCNACERITFRGKKYGFIARDLDAEEIKRHEGMHYTKESFEALVTSKSDFFDLYDKSPEFETLKKEMEEQAKKAVDTHELLERVFSNMLNMAKKLITDEQC
jgi:hypothetical protein